MQLSIQLPISEHFKDLTPLEALLYCYIQQNVDDRGYFIESDKQIANALSINQVSIPSLLNKLTKLVLIENVYLESEQRALKHIPIGLEANVKSPQGFIYIAIDTALPQYIKIGYSKDTKQREGTLKAEKPTIKFVKRFTGSRDQEQAVHRYLSRFRVRGEWFECSVEQGEKAIKKILGIS